MAIKYLFVMLILSVSSLALAYNATGSAMKISSGGNILTPALELSNSSGQKILIVGMAHIGYPPFYQAVNEYIKNWVAKDNRQHTTLLREFFTCKGQVLDNDESVQVSLTMINTLTQFNIDYTPANFINAKETQIDPILKIFKMENRSCLLDVDGKTMRPTYYVRRNKNWCDLAKTHAGACHWLSFDVPDSGNFKNAEGDLEMDLWPAGMQFVGSVLFHDYFSSSDLDFSNQTVKNIFGPSGYVILSYRNYLLANKTLEALRSGSARVVLPWGAAHVEGLFEIFKKQGFYQSNLNDIIYLKPSQKGSWDLVDSSDRDEDFPLSDHYSFQDK